MPARPSPNTREIVAVLSRAPGKWHARRDIVRSTTFSLQQVSTALKRLSSGKEKPADFGFPGYKYESKGVGAGMRHRFVTTDGSTPANGLAGAKLQDEISVAQLSDADLASEYLGSFIARHKRMQATLVHIREIINQALEGTEHG